MTTYSIAGTAFTAVNPVLPLIPHPYWTQERVARALHTGPDAQWAFGGVSTDTRRITKGDLFVALRGDRYDVDLKDAVKGAVLGKAAPTGPLKLMAPMPGKIVKVLVNVGDAVEAGSGVLVMEAMKMENELKTSRAGTVQEIRVREGQAVEMGAVLLFIG